MTNSAAKTSQMPQTHEHRVDNSARKTLSSDAKFSSYMAQDWAPAAHTPVTASQAAPYAAQRRARVSAAFPGKRLVIGAGIAKQRANDTDYLFRPDTAFTHLTGWGAAAQPGSVLVFEPRTQETNTAGINAAGTNTAGTNTACTNTANHTVTLYVKPSADKNSPEFFEDAQVGEFWIGPKPTLQQISELLQLPCKPLSEFTTATGDSTPETDTALGQFLDELRLVKDEYEIAQMQLAVDATGDGFNEVVANLPKAVATNRGERVIETVFHCTARTAGNWEGYNTIAAAGEHACTLHWETNDGPVRPGELVLLDAGVEVDSLYTADITRTLPISGEFTAVQRKVYSAVLEAADAAFAVAKPGALFRDVHAAALAVIETKVKEWGLWPQDADPEIPYHKRYMVHGTSHHLGIDVHDCTRARREMYIDAEIKPGMCFTIEPGLYFHPGDLTVPEEYWGIGVRIEDDIIITETGARNLSADIPRTVSEVEAWVQAALK